MFMFGDELQGLFAIVPIFSSPNILFLKFRLGP